MSLAADALSVFAFYFSYFSNRSLIAASSEVLRETWAHGWQRGFAFQVSIWVCEKEHLAKLFLFPGRKPFGCYSFKEPPKKENRVRKVDLLVKGFLFFTLPLTLSLALSFSLHSFALQPSSTVCTSMHVHMCICLGISCATTA